MIRNIRVLIVGSEVLNGFTVDTNSTFLIKELFVHGYRVTEVRKVHDNKEIILKTLNELSTSQDLIIMTGGLGPTEDDLTVELLCTWLNCEPIYDAYAQKRAEKLFKLKRGKHIDSKLAYRQTRIPAVGQPLKNTIGLAPGIWLPDVPLIALPGFPEEIKSIWPHALKKIHSCKLKIYFTRTIPIWGIGETDLFSQLLSCTEIQSGVHALPYGSTLFLTGSKQLVNKTTNTIKKQFLPYIVDNPIHAFIAFIIHKNISFGIVESCTGGLLTKLVTDIPGVSKIFKGGIIAYANQVKEQVMRISPELLSNYGAVSYEVATSLAHNGLSILDVDICIAITGIAGPDNQSQTLETGTVFISIADRQVAQVWTGKFYFPFGRERFRNAVAYTTFLALYQKYIALLNKWEFQGIGRHFYNKRP